MTNTELLKQAVYLCAQIESIHHLSYELGLLDGQDLPMHRHRLTLLLEQAAKVVLTAGRHRNQPRRRDVLRVVARSA